MDIVILLAVLCLSTGIAPVVRAAAVDTIGDVQDAVERILDGADADAVERILDDADADAVERILDGADADAVERILDGVDADAVERILDGAEADAVERILDGADADAVERILDGADADAVERILDGADADAVERIVNGEDATKGAHPHQVTLVNREGHQRGCGGSVIADTVVLTAAHCVRGDIIDDLQVVVNDHKLYEVEGPEQTIQVLRKIVHKNFSMTKMEQGLPYDIALLVLAEPVKDKSTIIPIATKQQGDFAGKQCTITGWGVGDKRYACHDYTESELETNHDEKRMCTDGHSDRVYTQGNNANYPGCKGCWCCKGRHYGGDRRRVSVLYTEHVKEPEGSVCKSRDICARGNNANYPGCESCWCCKENGRMSMTTLQELTITVLNQTDCLKWWLQLDKHGRTVCVSNGVNVATGSGACYGDSGGPLVCDGVLVGVTSWGDNECATTPDGALRPSVYTRVNYFYDWIQTKLACIESD